MFITHFTSEFTKNGLQLFPWSTSNECRPHRSDGSSHERYTPLRPVVTVASSLCKCQKKDGSCDLQHDVVLHVFYLTAKWHLRDWPSLIHWVKSVKLIKSLSPVSVPYKHVTILPTATHCQLLAPPQVENQSDRGSKYLAVQCYPLGQ